MRLAILDLGTNTFHLLIADVEKGTAPKELAKESDSIKLGEGGITTGTITEAAFARGINTINHFNEIIRKYDVDEIRAAGTAALRTAANGQEFIDRVKQNTGIEIEIIDGDKEAEIIYEGVRHAVKLPAAPVLIIDIGGGSVEFIICNEQQIFWERSYPIGAAKLMALFHQSDPICEDEINTIHQFLDKELPELETKSIELKPDILIGSAGAFDTFAELEVNQYQLDPALLQRSEFSFDVDRFISITDNLLKTTHQEREKIKGIPEVRVDMIIVSTILTRYILEKLKFRNMKLSAYSLKEGLLYRGL